MPIEIYNPTEDPENFYRGYVDTDHFLSGLSVKTACKKYLKLNLINNYNLIQCAKEHVWHIGRFNTYPTEEGAKEFQDMFHELFGLHVYINYYCFYFFFFFFLLFYRDYVINH